MTGNMATSMIATLLRATNGIQSSPAAVKPKKTLQLYDIENCPYCRLVREVRQNVIILDLACFSRKNFQREDYNI